ncbi:MAG: TolC family protein [Dysgonamonadaceae bacterium]
MKSKSRIFCSFAIALTFSLTATAQKALRLEDCRQQAIDNYPLIRQYDLVEKARQYSLENIAKSYLPQLNLNAQGTYQTEVTKLNLDASALPAALKIPSVSKDQYKATLDVTQLIWDGGAISAQKRITEANSEVDKQRIQVNLYAVKGTVNELFFGILAIDEQLKIIALTEQNLLSNKKMLESMMKNGVAMQSEMDQLDVELLNLAQNRIEQNSLRKSYLSMLGLFIHQELTDNTPLEKPIGMYDANEEVARPELQLYHLQIELMKKQNSAIEVKNMPKLGLFAQGGYGRPGLNMMEDKFKLFAQGGIKLTWNFGGLYTKKNEQRLIANNISSIETEKETFLFNTRLEMTKEQQEIDKMKELMKKDDAVIRLRERVKTAGESRYKNGTYQMNELIRDINNEALARQTKALHEIQYLKNIESYKQTLGK